jgi:hypothetical protein
MFTPNDEKLQGWASEYQVGWPSDPEELQQWLDSGWEPDRTWETFTVRSPGPEMLRRLRHYLACKPVRGSEVVMDVWDSGHPALALHVLSLNESLRRRSEYGGAAEQLTGLLDDLVSFEVCEERDVRKERADFVKRLQQEDKARQTSIVRIRQAFEQFMDLVMDDWQPLEAEEYLETIKEWKRQLRYF